MNKYKFTASERYAVYTTHGEKCYICGKPIDMKSMHIDHVIPESLLLDNEEMHRVFELHGLSSKFDINSFKNWLPSCSSCNLKKSARVFEPSLLFQIAIENAIGKSKRAIELSEKLVSRTLVTKAINTIERASESGVLDEEIIESLRPLINFHIQERNVTLFNEPIRITPEFKIISESNGIRIVKGRYGIGGGPIGPNVNSSFYCACGASAWNGARCVRCGEMSDD